MVIDLVPLSQLPSRYGIARSNLYNRLKDLQIEPTKQGRKAFVNAEQLQLLDGLHVHLERGGVTSDFIKQLQSQVSSEGLTTTANSNLELNSQNSIPNYGKQPIVVVQPTALLSALEAVLKRLIPSPKSRLNHLRELEEAYQNGWLLSTSEIADLLGLAPKTIAGYGTEFSDAGFVFSRVGTRKGGEIAWIVEKENDWYEPSTASSTNSVKEAFSSAFDPDDN